MIKQPIRSLNTSKPVPPRFCDVVIDGEKVYLEQKVSKNKYITIYWDDIVHQVESVIERNKIK